MALQGKISVQKMKDLAASIPEHGSDVDANNHGFQDAVIMASNDDSGGEKMEASGEATASQSYKSSSPAKVGVNGMRLFFFGLVCLFVCCSFFFVC
jgi:hypothetical protein